MNLRFAQWSAGGVAQNVVYLPVADRKIALSFSEAAPGTLAQNARILRHLSDPSHALESTYWQNGFPGRYRLYWSDAGTFDLDAERAEVVCHLVPGFSTCAVEEVLRGPVCSFFLIQCGFEPLHASAVVLEGKCVAFAGAAGAGKSSLAAFLVERGADYLTDDLLPLRYDEHGVTAFKGLPQLRLYKEAAQLLGWSGEEESSDREKLTIPLSTNGFSLPAKLEGVYLLDRQPHGVQCEIEFERLPPPIAFRALLENTMNDSLLSEERLTRQLQTFAWIANRLPVCRLSFPSGFQYLHLVREALREHLQRSKTK